MTSLNQYISATTNGYPITADPKQPLAGNNLLSAVAETHSDAMNTSKVLEDTTGKKSGHNDAGDGGSPDDRIAKAGYVQNQMDYYRDENIGVSWTTGALTDKQIWSLVESQHEGLFKDDPQFYGPEAGHRLAMLDDDMREVGLGVTTGTYKGNNATFVTEEFGSSGTQSFLTGVVYNDTDGDHFYGFNEAVQGVTVKVSNGNATVGTDATGSGGGWTVGEPGGTYAVTFSGGPLGAAVSATVEGGNLNAKVDLVNGNEIDASANTTLGDGARDLRLLGIGNINGTGNAGDNTLTGNKGNNVLDGGAGVDTAVYAGNKSAYTITLNANGTVTVAGAEGTDTLKSIEKIQFADQVYQPNPAAGAVTINDLMIAEGDAGTRVATFTVARSGGAAAFDVDFATADGTATLADGDYLKNAGTLHFAANEISKTISVTINGDTKAEASETFNVLLSNATNGATIAKNQGSATISNDDAAAVSGAVAINDLMITEGNAGTQVATFTVARTGGTAAFDVDFATADGTATLADGDYLKNAGTLHFAANETSKTVSVTINGDTKAEASETFNVLLSNATNGATIAKNQGSATISNDDAAAVSGAVTINDLMIAEGDAGTRVATFTVARTGGTAAFDVDFATADGTATLADGDYLKNAGTLHFAANETSKTVSVTINGDTKAEANETFNVLLSNATNGATIAKNQGSATISNDDAAAVSGAVAINDLMITEGNAGTQVATFTVARTGGTAAFDVDFATADGTATLADGDYLKNAGTLHFAANETSKTISVTINGDTKVEANETFNVLLSNATNGATISDKQGIATISNDDVAANHAPIVTGNDVSVAVNGSLAASSLFSAHDQEGDGTITKYAFWDGDNAGGHFATNGTTLASGQWNYVNAADLASVKYVGGSGPGSETLYVAAYDGKTWSSYDALQATTTAPVNHAPVVTAADHSVHINEWSEVASWLSYSDVDGNAATQYQFWDGGSGTGSGYFWTPDNPHQPAGTAITVAAADVGNLWLRGGQTAGSETMWVRAFDGKEWGDWDSFNFSTLPNSAPVAKASDHQLGINEWAKLSDWVSYSDADGDTATQYQFWDGGTGTRSGYIWTPDDAHHAAATAITVLASELDSAWVRGGQSAGSETMWVRAFDGHDWGAWNPFTMTTHT